eukprot:3723124-Amphidinium_carterae.1
MWDIVPVSANSSSNLLSSRAYLHQRVMYKTITPSFPNYRSVPSSPAVCAIHISLFVVAIGWSVECLFALPTEDLTCPSRTSHTWGVVSSCPNSCAWGALSHPMMQHDQVPQQQPLSDGIALHSAVD